MTEDRFKLFTRRLLAWGTVFPIVLILCFAVVWGAVHDNMELVNLAVGFAGGALSTVLAMYFGKRLVDE